MKRYLICLCLFFSLGYSIAQQAALKAGNKVFVENTSKNENAIHTAEQLEAQLKEWGYWKVVDKKEAADFQIKIDVTASKGITLTSWGGTSVMLVAKLIDPKGEVMWESNAYKSSPNGTNGFNSSKAVVNKLIRELKSKFAGK
ncbi:hypothetical protein [Xanthocytophaga flava]|uniref:hypothetical protein n=1 Tax=Xanthocytophaga flava TaxID=3048013 RepID=UPI0028D71B24|nr:hypothetical protein [Xanthocytophaga flavus]MDJ1469262.1 hypothetical protein [Xanthocytophaga flavus]